MCSCKIFEHIVCTNIMAHLDERKLLSDRQHALRRNRSCESQLITVINDWAKILDAGGQVDTFILNFQKAFDTPPHELLKCKLHVYQPRWLSWMRRPTGDQEVAGSTPTEVSNILLWRLIMKYFLQSFSPFR